jgi:folate-binding protein YgfZ
MKLGVVDLRARGRFVLRGADRVRFLQGMLTNEVEKLAAGQSVRAAMLTPKGRVIADMLVRKEEDSFWVTTDALLRDKLREAFDRHIIMDDVTLDDVTDKTGEIGVYGAQAHGVPGLAVLQAPLGLHLVGDTPACERALLTLVAGGAVGLDDAAVERLRIERGVSRYGAEISEEVLPLEAGLDDAISHTKGCYVGQEPVARVTTRGHVNKKIVGLVCSAAVKPGDVVSSADRSEAGVVTSATQSPTLGKPIALAFLHRSLWAPGTQVTVGAVPAEVTELPFVKW